MIKFEYARIGLSPVSGVRKRTRCSSPRKRRPRDNTHTEMFQHGQHLALFLTVGNVIVILHRDEGREVVRDCIVCESHVSCVSRMRSATMDSDSKTHSASSGLCAMK